MIWYDIIGNLIVLVCLLIVAISFERKYRRNKGESNQSQLVRFGFWAVIVLMIVWMIVIYAPYFF